MGIMLISDISSALNCNTICFYCGHQARYMCSSEACISTKNRLHVGRCLSYGRAPFCHAHVDPVKHACVPLDPPPRPYADVHPFHRWSICRRLFSFSCCDDRLGVEKGTDAAWHFLLRGHGMVMPRRLANLILIRASGRREANKSGYVRSTVDVDGAVKHLYLCCVRGCSNAISGASTAKLYACALRDMMESADTLSLNTPGPGGTSTRLGANAHVMICVGEHL